ncbi:MAG: serine/threonine protein kinase, partial [Myxococcales bacterium]|nr:serine/threonine protein kinase [Myxococcales bacterium]
EVAVKVIHPHLRDSREVVSRFNTEARAVAKLRHPNIVEVFDVSEADDAEQYLVVELLRGTTLRKLLLQHGAMPPEVAATLALELLAALGHAHANGVVHRDVKPENVLIEQRPGGAGEAGEAGVVVVKLTDFGIAKLLDAQGVTSTGQVLGSPAHMSPEQIEGGEVDARADLFGLGVLLYECLVGHLPFEGQNPAQVLRRVLEARYTPALRERGVVGDRFSAIADRALAHSPQARFPDATAMREALVQELERLGVSDAPGELARWYADPGAYVAAHTPRMIERLVALGNEARRRGDVLSAAGDFNRALAHAPNDPNLLRLVAAMNRAEARARLLHRAGMALLVSVGLGGVAFGLGRWVRMRGPGEVASSSATQGAIPAAPSSPPALAPSSATQVVAPAAPSASHADAPPRPSFTVSPPPAVPVPREPAARGAPPVSERTFTLDLTPKMGVKLEIDDEPPHPVSNGWVQHLDTKAHLLTFSCDVCNPEKRFVAVGEKDETLTVTVPIKPATLVIEGDAQKTYQVSEDPQLSVRSGANTIPLKSRFLWITVRQLETKTEQHVQLEAGKASVVSF